MVSGPMPTKFLRRNLPGASSGHPGGFRGDLQRVVRYQFFASGRPRRALSEFILRPGRAPEVSGRHPGAPLWAKMAPGGLGEGAWMVPGAPRGPILKRFFWNPSQKPMDLRKSTPQGAPRSEPLNARATRGRASKNGTFLGFTWLQCRPSRNGNIEIDRI